MSVRVFFSVYVIALVIGVIAATSADAACQVAPSGIVSCAENTTTDTTTNTNGAHPSSDSRSQLFSNGNPIAAQIMPGVTVGGAGLALVESRAPGVRGVAGRTQTIGLSNNGAVVANEGTEGGIFLNGLGGAVTYSGAGSVTNTIGPRSSPVTRATSR